VSKLPSHGDEGAEEHGVKWLASVLGPLNLLTDVAFRTII